MHKLSTNRVQKAACLALRDSGYGECDPYSFAVLLSLCTLLLWRGHRYQLTYYLDISQLRVKYR